MCCRLIIGLLSLCLVLATSQGTFAASPAGQDKAGENSTQGPRRHLANILFAGLAGAVLGLSTLSFYGRPQDRLSNIAVGFAIGVIVGTVYTTYKAAAEPREFYGLAPSKADTSSVELWTAAEASRRDTLAQTPRTGLVFEF